MPKRVAALSAKALAAIHPTNKPIEVVDGYVPGLRIRVLPNGHRTWSLNIRDSFGRRRRFEVGKDLGLSEARKKADKLRRDIRDGADPTSERRAARQRAQAAQDGVGTFGALLDTYFTKGAGAQQRRAAKIKRLLQTVFAALLDQPALDLNRTQSPTSCRCLEKCSNSGLSDPQSASVPEMGGKTRARASRHR